MCGGGPTGVVAEIQVAPPVPVTVHVPTPVGVAALFGTVKVAVNVSVWPGSIEVKLPLTAIDGVNFETTVVAAPVAPTGL